VECRHWLVLVDQQAAIGKPDEGDHRANAIGALISVWSKRKLIVWTGSFRKSERVEGHGNLQRIWRKLAETSPTDTVAAPRTVRADPSERDRALASADVSQSEGGPARSPQQLAMEVAA
jgi:hypothetical protein